MSRITTHYHGFTIEHQLIVGILFQFGYSAANSIWINVDIVWVFKFSKRTMRFYDFLVFFHLFNHFFKMILSRIVVDSLTNYHGSEKFQYIGSIRT